MKTTLHNLASSFPQPLIKILLPSLIQKKYKSAAEHYLLQLFLYFSLLFPPGFDHPHLVLPPSEEAHHSEVDEEHFCTVIEELGR